LDCKEIKHFPPHETETTEPRKVETVQYTSICTVNTFVCLSSFYIIVYWRTVKARDRERYSRSTKERQERESGKREPIRCGKIYLHSNGEACCL